MSTAARTAEHCCICKAGRACVERSLTCVRPLASRALSPGQREVRAGRAVEWMRGGRAALCQLRPDGSDWLTFYGGPAHAVTCALHFGMSPLLSATFTLYPLTSPSHPGQCPFQSVTFCTITVTGRPRGTTVGRNGSGGGMRVFGTTGQGADCALRARVAGCHVAGGGLGLC